MNEIAEKRFKFGQAAYGIGVTEKTLRNWLQRGQVDLITERGPDDAHYSFAFADLVILSAVAELVRYGCPVRTAFDGLVDLRRPLAMLAMYKNTPMSAVDAAIASMVLDVNNDEGLWKIEYKRSEKINMFSTDHSQSSYLVINLSMVLSDVFARMTELDTK